MNTILKILFLYLPALFGWIIGIITMLIMMGWMESPDAFNPNDYEKVTSYNKDGTEVTIYAKP